MMCGVCGSGKTTYSKQKEKEGYIRLSIDEEMWKIYGKKGIDYPDSQYEELSEKVELTLRERLLKLKSWRYGRTCLYESQQGNFTKKVRQKKPVFKCQFSIYSN